MKQTTLLSTALLASGLFAQQLTLSPVLVTAPTRVAEPLAQTTSDIEVITSDEIAADDDQSVAEALHTLPGVSYAQNGGYGQPASIYLRGLPTDKTLVLIDGIRFNDPTSLNGAAYEHLLTQGVSRIEVLEGAQSGIWGADASAGVIAISSWSPEHEGLNADAMLEGGSYRTLRYGLNLGYKTHRYDFALSSAALLSEGYSAMVPPHEDPSDYEKDGYRNYTNHLKIGLNISDDDRIETSFMNIAAHDDYDGDSNFSASIATKANNATYTTTSKTRLYGLNYRHSASWGAVKLYASRSDFSRDYPQGFTHAYDGSVLTYGAQGTYRYAKSAQMVAGVEQNRFKHKNTIARDYRNDALFLNNHNSFGGFWGGKTILSEAVRYDRYNAFSNRFTYRVGIKHIAKRIPHFWASANYGTGYNVPTLYNLYGPYVGNPNLHPEKSRSFDLTLHYRTLQATYFHQSLKEMIDYVYDPATFTGSYENVSGKSTFEGVELSWSQEFSDLSSRIGANYTWLRTRDKEGKALIRRPKNSANLTYDYLGIPNTRIGLQLHCVGKRMEYTGAKMGGYALLHLSADYAYSDRIDLYAKVQNALDKRYETAATYSVPGRALFAGIRYLLP